MAFYDIHHTIPLTKPQCDTFASRLTTIHCSHFHTLSLFVNIRFTQVTEANNLVYAGGRQSFQNAIHLHLRDRPSTAETDQQTQRHYRDLIAAIYALWASVLKLPCAPHSTPSTPSTPIPIPHPQQLHSVLVLDGIISGSERGFSIPKPGESSTKRWIANFREDIEGIAKREDGDEMGSLLREVKEREDREREARNAEIDEYDMFKGVSISTCAVM